MFAEIWNSKFCLSYTKQDYLYLVLLHSTWQEIAPDLNLLCSWAWNQIFIFLSETTGNLSVGLSFLQYLHIVYLKRNQKFQISDTNLMGFLAPGTFTKNLSPFLQRPGSLLSTKNVEQVSFISLQAPFNCNKKPKKFKFMLDFCYRVIGNTSFCLFLHSEGSNGVSFHLYPLGCVSSTESINSITISFVISSVEVYAVT